MNGQFIHEQNSKIFLIVQVLFKINFQLTTLKMLNLGVATICCNYRLHYFRLKIYRILNLFLAQLFPRGVYVVDKSTYSLSRRLAFLKSAIKSTSKIFPRIINTLILHHAIRRINGKSTKFTFMFTSEIRNRVRSPTIPAPGHTAIPNFAHASRIVLLCAFRSLSTTTISTPAS